MRGLSPSHFPTPCSLPRSENEELEEIASADLKFLLLPALLGAMTLKQVDLSRRKEHLESAREHFLGFLKLCRNYGLGSFQLPPGTAGEEEPRSPAGPQDPAQPNLVAMAMSRTAKIERWGRLQWEGLWESLWEEWEPEAVQGWTGKSFPGHRNSLILKWSF